MLARALKGTLDGRKHTAEPALVTTGLMLPQSFRSLITGGSLSGLQPSAAEWSDLTHRHAVPRMVLKDLLRLGGRKENEGHQKNTKQ